MKLKIKRVHEKAKLPIYGSQGAACFDLYAATLEEESFMLYGEDSFVVEKSRLYDTGLQVEVPEGHVMMIYSRSGHGFKEGITLANGTGVIDSDYRGNIKVKLVSPKPDATMPEAGERIAQAMIIPVPQVEFEEVAELSATERGEGGFGSTGVK